eukprot:2932323-Prymnesium_polylepis.1
MPSSWLIRAHAALPVAISAFRARAAAGPLFFGDTPAFLSALCHALSAPAVMRRGFSGDSF